MFAPKGAASSPPKSSPTALGPGDRVAVIGASGNVGRLVALRLSDDVGRGLKVRAVARKPERASGFFAAVAPNVEVVAADTTRPESLPAALEGCDALVICTGTTAFPTLAWRNGNTPEAVDARGVANVLEAWQAANPSPAAKKRVVLMSSIGVERRDSFPFKILNAAGVLSAKARGEDSLRAAVASGAVGSCAVVRPGQLIGGPYDNNYYLGTLAKLDRPARSVLLWDKTKKDAIELGPGDSLLGDTLRSTVAELVVRALVAPECPADFSVVNVDGPMPDDETLSAQFKALLI